MIEIIELVNSKVNGFVWGVPAIVCILGVGLYLSVRTGFIQFRKFGLAMKNTIGRIFEKKQAKEGAMTPFQAVCTALSATVGTGNISGVAGAIALGGPGAVFWMWISAFLGMCTKFAEVTLAVHFREKNEQGDYVGGPMYYIKNGLKKHWLWLAYVFAAFGICAVFGTGNAAQANTIVASINSALLSYNLLPESSLRVTNVIIGVAIAIIVALILIGGIKRIGRVSEKLVPVMAILYVVLGIGVIVINLDRIPEVFASIFRGAFNPRAVTGGIVGSFFLSMRNGISRGIFSNEAGLGTGSIAHACADTDEPVQQGMFGIFAIRTPEHRAEARTNGLAPNRIIVCTMTALVILLSGVDIVFGKAAGSELTISGFVSVYGNWITIFTAIAMCCFAFSTIIGWGLYGSRCAEFLFGSKATKIFLALYSLISIVGATMDLGLVWSISETFNGLMAIPNLIAVFLLSPVVLKLVKEYFAKQKK